LPAEPKRTGYDFTGWNLAADGSGSIGWKTGPGYLFVDTRVEYDGHFWETPAADRTFYRNMVRLSIGYEMSLLEKSKGKF
jgi:hypothetical protein